MVDGFPDSRSQSWELFELLLKSGGAEGVAQLRFGAERLAQSRFIWLVGRGARVEGAAERPRRTGRRGGEVSGVCSFCKCQECELLSTTANSSPHVPETFAWRLILERACQSLPESFGASVFLGDPERVDLQVRQHLHQTANSSALFPRRTKAPRNKSRPSQCKHCNIANS